jgi:hypothetical protein
MTTVVVIVSVSVGVRGSAHWRSCCPAVLLLLLLELHLLFLVLIHIVAAAVAPVPVRIPVPMVPMSVPIAAATTIHRLPAKRIRWISGPGAVAAGATARVGIVVFRAAVLRVPTTRVAAGGSGAGAGG